MFARFIPFCMASFVLSLVPVGLLNGLSKYLFSQLMPFWVAMGIFLAIWIGSVWWYIRIGERLQKEAERKRREEAQK